MIGTKRRYSWHIRHEDPLMTEEVRSQVAALVDRWCTTWPKKYMDGVVSGLGIEGLIQVDVTVKAANQWDAHKRMTYLGRALAISSKVSVKECYDPDPYKLPYPQRRVPVADDPVPADM